MFDPFPNEIKENKKKLNVEIQKKDNDKLIYPKEMYIEGFSPWVKYFPTDEMFFKLMRGSLGIPDVTYLWFVEK